MKGKHSHIYLSFSVDWEGENFSGVKDLLKTREEVEKIMGREIPLTHFICPAYYTEKVPRATKQIRSVCRPDIDEIASHVHCWKSIVSEARLKFRTDHDFHAGTERAGSGHGVPFGVYEEEAFDILRFTNQLIEYELDCGKLESFRCGGTMASDAVLKALLKAGMKYDSSAFPASALSRGLNPRSRGNGKDAWGESNGRLTDYKIDLWGYHESREPHVANSLSRAANGGAAITFLTQPYRVSHEGKSLIEIPINGGISDYVKTDKTVWPTFEKLIKNYKGHGGPVYFHFGCHQEGEVKYKRPFVDFFTKLSSYLHRDSSLEKALRFVTVREAGAVAAKELGG